MANLATCASPSWAAIVLLVAAFVLLTNNLWLARYDRLKAANAELKAKLDTAQFKLDMVQKWTAQDAAALRGETLDIGGRNG